MLISAPNLTPARVANGPNYTSAKCAPADAPMKSTLTPALASDPNTEADVESTGTPFRPA